MKSDIKVFEKNVLSNLSNIRDAYNKAISRRELAKRIDKMINDIRGEIILNNNFKADPGIINVCGEFINDSEFFCFIHDDEKEKYNDKFYESIKHNIAFYDFFNEEVGVKYDNIGWFDVDRSHHYEEDKALVKLLRDASGVSISESYDFDSIDKEILIIGKILNFYKDK